MKFNLATFSIFAAAFIPLIILILAITWDRRQRKQIEKPPQEGKLLRPPGYSLSIRFDEALELLIKRIFAASMLSAFSSVGVIALAISLGAQAPVFL